MPIKLGSRYAIKDLKRVAFVSLLLIVPLASCRTGQNTITKSPATSTTESSTANPEYSSSPEVPEAAGPAVEIRGPSSGKPDYAQRSPGAPTIEPCSNNKCLDFGVVPVGGSSNIYRFTIDGNSLHYAVKVIGPAIQYHSTNPVEPTATTDIAGFNVVDDRCSGVILDSLATAGCTFGVIFRPVHAGKVLGWVGVSLSLDCSDRRWRPCSWMGLGVQEWREGLAMTAGHGSE